MAKKIEALRGMDDILPGEVEKWQWLEEKARWFFGSRGYQEIRTPLVEYTDLFSRSIGETTDIVHKEMYTFEDRGGRSITLRPEMTASVARAVIENNLLRNAGSIPLFYMGPMFRAERPQAGRKRQFHQIGAEIVNQPLKGTADFLIIQHLWDFLKYLNVAEPRLKINDLTAINGPQKGAIREKLKAFFTEHKAKLDKDSLFRLDKNVLRIFDSKDENVRAVIAKTPWKEILGESSDEFKNTCSGLDLAGIPYKIDHELVRGLDYYTGTVFEITLQGLGAQDAVAGGGRYDHLYGELGGPQTACTGFSLGMERLLMALEKNDPSIEKQMRDETVYMVPLNDSKQGEREYEKCKEAVYQATLRLKEAGIKAVYGGVAKNISVHLKKANKIGARYVVIKGPEEMEEGTWQIKAMNEKTQKSVKEGVLLATLLKEIQGIEL